MLKVPFRRVSLFIVCEITIKITYETLPFWYIHRLWFTSTTQLTIVPDSDLTLPPPKNYSTITIDTIKAARDLGTISTCF